MVHVGGYKSINHVYHAVTSLHIKVDYLGAVVDYTRASYIGDVHPHIRVQSIVIRYWARGEKELVYTPV